MHNFLNSYEHLKKILTPYFCNGETFYWFHFTSYDMLKHDEIPILEEVLDDPCKTTVYPKDRFGVITRRRAYRAPIHGVDFVKLFSLYQVRIEEEMDRQKKMVWELSDPDDKTILRDLFSKTQDQLESMIILHSLR